MSEFTCYGQLSPSGLHFFLKWLPATRDFICPNRARQKEGGVGDERINDCIIEL